jgi:phosphatidylglycerophosphatase A
MSEKPGAPPSLREAKADKPRFTLFVATACGLGYIPKAPGTFGSLVGLIAFSLMAWTYRWPYKDVLIGESPFPVVHPVLMQLAIALPVGIVGVWAATRTSVFLGIKDPQSVVIDEVSGQHLTYLLGLAPANWKYLLLGFILFRVFDIWKPFPVRQAESLPRGWGIMADDWVAAVYAAAGLWIARAAGL